MARQRPTVAMDAKRAPHEQKLDDMHDALYKLGSQAAPPRSADKLLPSDLASPDAAVAKKHINRLHKAFKSLKKGKE